MMEVGDENTWFTECLPIYNAATFEYHLDGPFADPEINRLDIPPLFRNPCMKNGMIQWY